MSEQHLLVSTYLGPLAGHAYLVRRNSKQSEVKEDQHFAANMLSHAMEQLAEANNTWWPPMLVTTKLTPKSGKSVQDILLKHSPDQVRTPLNNYINKEAPLFMSVWAMPSDDPDCEELMDLH